MKRSRKKSFTNNFDWGLYPETEKLLQREVARFLQKNSFANKLSKLMWDKTSTKIFDWIDHIVLPRKRVKAKTLTGLGFEEMDILYKKRPVDIIVRSR